MPAPNELHDLVERFKRNYDQYTSQEYKEADLRKEFIDPLFEMLGWDMANKKGYAEQYKEVKYEPSLEIEGGTKSPDYEFRIGDKTIFYVEAKKPYVDIGLDKLPSFQLRRYAFSRSLPLSILTNFDSISVYDGRFRPNKNDSPATARVMRPIAFEELEERWNELADIFSKDAVLKGSFDRLVEHRPKRGTSEVNSEFLREIEGWREALAKNIALRNPKLTIGELNYAVQTTIDRIVFLRMCEDRGTELPNQLRKIAEGGHLYRRLFDLFQLADMKYNSGLFHFHQEKKRDTPPDEVTPKLKIDDEVLGKIVMSLYYPDSPFQFDVIPADILGQVYEQFLGKIVRLTEGHHAKVEEKPEVKKAGGVYYTPTYIVSYIVENTVGTLCKGKSPMEMKDLRILDPACGSGSFLIRAYMRLLKEHLDWYLEHSPKKWRDEVFQDSKGEWMLTLKEKKRILLSSIYGVDIDAQAVEVTRLNLLLKALEGESRESIDNVNKWFREPALPDLGSNIKCGNSLVDFDYQEALEDLPAEELRLELDSARPFRWASEFGGILKSGGFDAVIGNPPYIRVRMFKDLYPSQSRYLESRYACATHVWDIYMLFYEKALSLVKDGGRTSFILPIQTLHQPNCESLRSLLFKSTSINEVVDLAEIKVFQNAIIKNCIITCTREQREGNYILIKRPKGPAELPIESQRKWSQAAAYKNPGHSLKLDLMSDRSILCDKLEAKSWRFGELFYCTFGLRSCAKGKGHGGKERLIVDTQSNKNAKPYLEGREINRYVMFPSKRFIKYIPEEMYSPRSPELFETPKIISQSMLSKKRLIATIDRDGHYVEQSLVCIVPHGVLTEKKETSVPLEYALGVLNSKIESFYFGTKVIDYSLGGGLIHATPGSHEKLILPKAEEPQIEKMISLVGQMMRLQTDFRKAKAPDEKTQLQRTIDATDSQIDALTYELFDLTEEEVRIVETQE